MPHMICIVSVSGARFDSPARIFASSLNRYFLEVIFLTSAPSSVPAVKYTVPIYWYLIYKICKVPVSKTRPGTLEQLWIFVQQKSKDST
jgi:hypothetical protein